MTDGDSSQPKIRTRPTDKEPGNAEDLEKQIDKWLVSMRIEFPSNPELAHLLDTGNLAAIAEKGYSQAEIDGEMDREKVTEGLKSFFRQKMLDLIGEYGSATFRDGTFAAKWPLILDKVAKTDQMSAMMAAQGYMAIVNDLFAPDSAHRESFVLDKNKDAVDVARRAYLIHGMREMMAQMSISDAEYQKRKKADAGYSDAGFESNLNVLLDQYFYFTLQTGTFDRDWPAKLEETTKFDSEIALKAAVKFIQNPQRKIIANEGRPQAVAIDIPTDKFIAACSAAQQACVSAAGQGHNAAAAETMAVVNREIRIRLRHELPADQADALRALEDSATDAEGVFLTPGIQETIAALSISDEELGQRRTLHGYSEGDTERRLLAILDEYFYHALKKGTLLTDWPAKLEEISSFDPDLAAQAAAQFFHDPQASVRTAEEFNRIAAAAEQACAAASAKGYFANAARTMADILLQIRKNIKALAGNEEMVSALRPVGNDAVEKFNTIMEAWATAAFKHPEDPRSPEAIQTAEKALMTFVGSLSAEGFNMGGNQAPAPVPAAS